jgi:U1 small nuclear ribonucleoprotein 70kDa
VARISFDTTEKKLRREFEQYGPVRAVKMINDREDKSR